MKRHRTDALSLTFGLIFLGAVVIWFLDKVASSVLPGMGWVVAGGLIIIGVIGLMSALRSDRARPTDRDRTAAADETDEQPPLGDTYPGFDADVADITADPANEHR